jgi:hypothetical protein
MTDSVDGGRKTNHQTGLFQRNGVRAPPRGAGWHATTIGNLQTFCTQRSFSSHIHKVDEYSTYQRAPSHWQPIVMVIEEGNTEFGHHHRRGKRKNENKPNEMNARCVEQNAVGGYDFQLNVSPETSFEQKHRNHYALPNMTNYDLSQIV